MAYSSRSLRSTDSVSEWGQSKSGRLLQSIRRDMDLKENLFRNRLRNEEILSLSYRDGMMSENTPTMGGAASWERIRENALNLPYRQLRWYESQATSKKMVIKVNRDAGAGQRAGGPRDDETGMWVGIALGRVAYEAGFRREMKSLIAEVMPRGTSVMRIGYHEQTINLSEAREVGKNAQSVVVDVLGEEDIEAKPGQAHAEISEGLLNMAQDPEVQLQAGQGGVETILARKDSHDEADAKEESDMHPKESTRLIRRKAWMQKKRVGEDVGWAPWVYDVEDTPWWWERHVWTVAEVKRSELFTAKFRRNVEGYDGRNVSEVFRGGDTPSTESMGSDARQAMTEDVLDDDERMVEWFEVYYRRPDMKSGGIRKIVAPESPDFFVHSDESNPNVDEKGFSLIPGFYPYFDFTPILSSLTVPERTCGIPPVAVGMGHFEKIIEYNRLRQEAALKSATRIVQIHPGLKSKVEVLAALQNGEIGYAFIAEGGMLTADNKMVPAFETYAFPGQNPEIDKEAAREEADWVKVTGMPPAVLQGMGTAKTATQDSQGIAAGERESGTIIAYFETRMADVLAGLRGIIRGNYDDEDFIKLLGAEGAAVMKAWQTGTEDVGDEIEVTFGVGAQAQETVERKQLMEAITLQRGEVEPLTQLPKYDSGLLFEELNRRLNVGAPKLDETPMRQMQQMILQLSQQVQQLSGINPLTGEGQEKGDKKPGAGGDKQTKKPTSGEKKQSRGGPNPSEGDGPSQGNISAGAKRGTFAEAGA